MHKLFNWLIEQHQYKTVVSDDVGNEAEDREDLKKHLRSLEQNDIGGVHIRNFYGTMYLDPHITKVGVSPSHGKKKPDIIVRRHGFPTRARLPHDSKVTEVRVLREGMRVTLISPVLIAGQRK